MPTQERLRELFDYRDGALFNRSASRARRQGRAAGGLNGRYLYACVDYQYVAVHRLIWAWHNGEIPEGLLVDHIDRNALNNRIENLRLASHTTNSRNRSVGPKSRSGVVGVFPSNTYAGKWRAMISLGTFDTLEQAIAARKKAEKVLGYFTL